MGHPAHALALPERSRSRHRPESTVLYQTVAEHWPAFVQVAEEHGGLPRFVVKEFEEYLRCGRLEHGCLHLVCRECGYAELVAFSCKQRGFCPSCLGRRMADTAVHLEQSVLPRVPIRHWICSLPWGLRALLGYDRKLCAEVVSAFMAEVDRSLCWRSKRELGLASVADAHTGGVVAVQRTDSALRLNVHFHALVLDGVFVHEKDDPRAGSQKPPFRVTWHSLAQRRGMPCASRSSLEVSIMRACFASGLRRATLVPLVTLVFAASACDTAKSDDGAAAVGGAAGAAGAGGSGAGGLSCDTLPPALKVHACIPGDAPAGVTSELEGPVLQTGQWMGSEGCAPSDGVDGEAFWFELQDASAKVWRFHVSLPGVANPLAVGKSVHVRYRRTDATATSLPLRELTLRSKDGTLMAYVGSGNELDELELPDNVQAVRGGAVCTSEGTCQQTSAYRIEMTTSDGAHGELEPSSVEVIGAYRFVHGTYWRRVGEPSCPMSDEFASAIGLGPSRRTGRGLGAPGRRVPPSQGGLRAGDSQHRTGCNTPAGPGPRRAAHPPIS